MSVTLLEITASPPSSGTTTGNGSGGSERVSLSRQASSVFGKMEPKPLNLITIWGPARTGKSFFMNALAGTESDVFRVSGGIDPCTVGAFISSTTRSLAEFGNESGGPSLSSSFAGMKIGPEEGPAIGFVDVEGQGDKHNSYEIKLATPLLLLSKVAIFNWHGLPNKATILDRLGMMRVAAGKVNQSQRKGAFGDLVVLLRDVSEREEVKTQSLLFDPETNDDGSYVTDEDTKHMKNRNEIRKDLKASFKSVRVCCLPPPHPDITGDRAISQSEVSPAFAAKVNKLRLDLAKDVLNEGHFVGNEKVMGGAEISSLLTLVCSEVNKELKDFSPLSLMESVQHGRAKTVLDDSKKKFSESVSTSIEGAPSMSKAALTKAIEAAKSTAVDYFKAQNLAESVASEYRKMLDEAITEGSNARYAAQERQFSDAKNRIDSLVSDSFLRVDTKVNKIFVKLPMEDEELERLWEKLCSDVHGDLMSDIKKHVGGDMLEDLQEALPTLQQLEERVLGKYNNMKGSNMILRQNAKSMQDMKDKQDQQKEDTASLQQQLDEQRKLREKQERVLEGLKESREEERSRQRERDAETRRLNIESTAMLISAVCGAMNSGGQGQGAQEYGSSTRGSGSTAAPAAAPAEGGHPGDVDVGIISNHVDAEKKAREYMASHPNKEWTGHWKTPFIRVRNKAPVQAVGGHPGDVDVGFISNHVDAEKKARKYMASHPNKEWTGHWKTPFIRVRNKA